MDPNSEPADHGRRVRFSASRWLLAPLTTWSARRLAKEYGPGMDARTAWALARLSRHPEEKVFGMHHLGGDDQKPKPDSEP